MITQKSFEYEIKNDNAIDENGNATHGENLMILLYGQMKTITWSSQATNSDCATEYGRITMGTIDGTSTWNGSEMKMMCDHWTYLTKRYYVNSSVTDNSGDWVTENVATAGGDLSMTNWKKWYYTNKVGWDTTNNTNDGGHALIVGDDYYDGGNLTTRLAKIKYAKVEIYDDKARSTAITGTANTSLKNDWTESNYGLYVK